MQADAVSKGVRLVWRAQWFSFWLRITPVFPSVDQGVTSQEHRGATTIGERVETVLNYWTVTIFLPALLVALAILVLIIRATEKH
jgi:hypothetical protein